MCVVKELRIRLFLFYFCLIVSLVLGGMVYFGWFRDGEDWEEERLNIFVCNFFIFSVLINNFNLLWLQRLMIKFISNKWCILLLSLFLYWLIYLRIKIYNKVNQSIIHHKFYLLSIFIKRVKKFVKKIYNNFSQTYILTGLNNKKIKQIKNDVITR